MAIIVSRNRYIEKVSARTQGMTEKVEDPRPLPKFYRLPYFATAWRRWGDTPELARTLISLGVKLTDADAYRSRLQTVRF